MTFWTRNLQKMHLEDQIKDLLDKDPTAIQAYITGYYKNMFSPEAQQSHD